MSPSPSPSPRPTAPCRGPRKALALVSGALTPKKGGGDVQGMRL
jgi:hypothetical protein